MESSERKKYSPVICWTSEWQGNTLKIKRLNPGCSNFQKAIDKEMARRAWKQ